MKCPIDSSILQMNNRDGVEIDYCPDCRGVWLDRGELDKIIERNNSQVSPSSPVESRNNYRRDVYEDESYKKDDNYKRRKKRSFLEDMFDF